MRASGIGPITGAVVQRLASGPDVTALVGTRIYDEPPAAPSRPYLRVGVRNESPDDTVGQAGVDAVVEVMVVSDYAGDREIGQIASAVRDRLDVAPLTVDGFARPADVEYEQGLDGFTQVIGGISVRHRPLWFRVRVW